VDGNIYFDDVTIDATGVSSVPSMAHAARASAGQATKRPQ
jgi:hypothetical protein